MLNSIVGLLGTPSGGLPVSGAALWLDASDATTFSYSSGSLVSQWNDKSGNGRNFTQATVGLQPTRNTNVQNGLPALDFNGDLLVNTTYNWGSSASTFFIVAKENAGGTGYQVILGTGTGATGQWGYGIGANPPTDTNQLAIFNIGAGLIKFNSQMTGSNADVLAFVTAGYSGSTVVANLFFNGSTDTNNPVTSPSTTTATGAVLGAAAGGIEGFISNICEVIIYPSQLSTGDRNLVEAYLKTKWGTP
jgi:hypothetical protein